MSDDAPAHPKPPTTFVWREAVKYPIPEPEGDRALLLWDAEAEEVFKAEWTGGFVSPGQYTDDQCWRAPGAEIEHFTPGPMPSYLYWTWADGDPWTRRSPEARRAEKARYFAEQYGAHEALAARIEATMQDQDAGVPGAPPKGLGFVGTHHTDVGAWKAHKVVAGRTPSAPHGTAPPTARSAVRTSPSGSSWASK